MFKEPYNEMLEMARSQGKDAFKEALRFLCINDLYFLCKYILGYSWLTHPVHWDLCQEIQKDENLSWYLLPRGHCKTQIFTIGDSIRNYLKMPMIPIAIVCDVLKRATKKTMAIKWHFEKNTKLRDIFEDLIWHEPERQSAKWTNEEFILPGHDGRQEPSIQAASLENQPTGLHFPRIKCDDIVTPETVTTAEQMMKNKDQYGLMRSSILQAMSIIKTNDGEVIFPGNIQGAGTIYDDGDLHTDFMQKGSGYKIYIKPATVDETGESCLPTVPGAKVLWPEQFDIPVLTAIMNDPTVGIYTYSCQYSLNPQPKGRESYFKMEKIGRYGPNSHIQAIPLQVHRYVGLDTALSEKRKADWTVFFIVAVDIYHRVFLENILRVKVDAAEIVDMMLDVQRSYKPLLWGSQSDMIRKSIGPFLRRKMMETGIICNVDDTVPMKDKVANARSIQGRVNEGMYFLPEKGIDQPDWLANHEYELSRFPRARKDDTIDAASFVGYLLDKMAALEIPLPQETRRPPASMTEVAWLEHAQIMQLIEFQAQIDAQHGGVI